MSFQYSVVIPAFNTAATIGEAVESVLSQTVPPAEVIVVDDGSTDETAAIVAAMPAPVRLIRRANGGAGAATTQGIHAVSHPLLATLDSDDVWLPRKIERQLDYLAAHPEYAGVFTSLQVFRGSAAQPDLGPVQQGWSRTSMLIDLAAARAVGDIVDPPGGRGEMIDWFARCTGMGFRLGMLDEVLALRRLRPGSLSYGRDARDVGYLHVARQAMLRRRQQLQAASAQGENR